MNVRGSYSIKKEHFFLFSAAPAFTGFSVSFLDLIIVPMFFLFWLKNRMSFSTVSLSMLFLSCSIVTIGNLANSGVIDFINYFQWILFIITIFSVHSLVSNGFISPYEALKYWSYGIFLNVIVVILQQSNTLESYFMLPEQKSFPLPGYDVIRSAGLLFNPNSLAAFCVLAFIISLYFKRYILCILTVITAVSSFSKTIFLIPVFLVVVALTSNGVRKKILASIILMSALIALIPKLLSLLEYRLENAESLGSRSKIINYFLDKDYTLYEVLFGLGSNQDIVTHLGRVHNKFLSIFVQFGSIIGVVFSILIILLLVSSVKSIQEYSLRIYVGFFMVSWLALASVSTFTFFTFEWVGLVLFICYAINERGVVRKGGNFQMIYLTFKYKGNGWVTSLYL